MNCLKCSDAVVASAVVPHRAIAVRHVVLLCAWFDRVALRLLFRGYAMPSSAVLVTAFVSSSTFSLSCSPCWTGCVALWWTVCVCVSVCCVCCVSVVSIVSCCRVVFVVALFFGVFWCVFVMLCDGDVTHVVWPTISCLVALAEMMLCIRLSKCLVEFLSQLWRLEIQPMLLCWHSEFSRCQMSRS